MWDDQSTVLYCTSCAMNVKAEMLDVTERSTVSR